MPPTAPKTGDAPLDPGGQAPDQVNPQGAPMDPPRGETPPGPLETSVTTPPEPGLHD